MKSLTCNICLPDCFVALLLAGDEGVEGKDGKRVRNDEVGATLVVTHLAVGRSAAFAMR